MTGLKSIHDVYLMDESGQRFSARRGRVDNIANGMGGLHRRKQSITRVGAMVRGHKVTGRASRDALAALVVLPRIGHAPADLSRIALRARAI